MLYVWSKSKRSWVFTGNEYNALQMTEGMKEADRFISRGVDAQLVNTDGVVVYPLSQEQADALQQDKMASCNWYLSIVDKLTDDPMEY
jgi:hypothetical protein